MEAIVLVIHLLIALALVGVVLLQRSEGGLGGLGGSSGGGMGGLIGNRTTANLLTRATAVLAAAFMATSITLAIFAGNVGTGGIIVDEPSGAAQPAAPTEPATPAEPAAPSVPTGE